MNIKQTTNDFLRLAIRKKVITISAICLIALVGWINHVYHSLYDPNVVKTYWLYINKGEDFEKIFSTLKANSCLNNTKTFHHFARLKDYDKNIKPGVYKLEPGWSNNKLINTLKSGSQTPVLITFNNIRTMQDLAGKVSKQIQCDSATLISKLNKDSVALKYGYKPETFPALFIPNSYFVYWTISPDSFIDRMKHEHSNFWNKSRKAIADSLKLTIDQVVTLASIVQEESNNQPDRQMIAGVYLNRLKDGWPLQADPTIRFALKDFTLRRILTEHLSTESPYNTYTKTGLPPGPINFPEISSLEAVLHYTPNKFYYFCAKEDLSGTHNFAKTLAEHNRNAGRYQQALNKLKIYK